MAQTNYLQSEDVKLWRLEDGSLVMKNGNRKQFLSPPRRALPLSEHDKWIVFSDIDGNEIGVLQSVNELEDASQTVLREALAREYSLERITRILEVDKEPLTGQTNWRVEIAAPVEIENSSPPSLALETDAVEIEDDEEKPGTLSKMASFLTLSRDTSNSEDAVSVIEREFTINSQDDVATARYPHIYIVDIERQRYEIVNCEELDLESRKAADRFF